MERSKGQLKAKVGRLRTRLNDAHRGVETRIDERQHPLELKVDRLDRKIFWLWWLVGAALLASLAVSLSS